LKNFSFLYVDTDRFSRLVNSISGTIAAADKDWRQLRKYRPVQSQRNQICVISQQS